MSKREAAAAGRGGRGGTHIKHTDTIGNLFHSLPCVWRERAGAKRKILCRKSMLLSGCIVQQQQQHVESVRLKRNSICTKCMCIHFDCNWMLCRMPWVLIYKMYAIVQEEQSDVHTIESLFIHYRRCQWFLWGMTRINWSFVVLDFLYLSSLTEHSDCYYFIFVTWCHSQSI